MQVVLESRWECREAQKLLGMIKTAFPEVLTAIKTKQLAQEILLNKEEHIGEVAKTGGAVQMARLPLSHSIGEGCLMPCCIWLDPLRRILIPIHHCNSHQASHD